MACYGICISITVTVSAMTTPVKATVTPHLDYCRASNCSFCFHFPNLQIILYTVPGVGFFKHVAFLMHHT